MLLNGCRFRIESLGSELGSASVRVIWSGFRVLGLGTLGFRVEGLGFNMRALSLGVGGVGSV